LKQQCKIKDLVRLQDISFKPIKTYLSDPDDEGFRSQMKIIKFIPMMNNNSKKSFPDQAVIWTKLKKKKARTWNGTFVPSMLIKDQSSPLILHKWACF